MQDMRKSHGRKILSLPLRNDASGIAPIFVTIALPVIIGLALLAVDVGRFLTLHPTLAHGAGATALMLVVRDDKALFGSLTAEIKRARFDRRDLAMHSPDVSTAIDLDFAMTELGGDLGTSGSS